MHGRGWSPYTEVCVRNATTSPVSLSLSFANLRVHVPSRIHTGSHQDGAIRFYQTGDTRGRRVPLTSLSEPLLIGAMCDQQHKPDLLFLTRTSLDVAGVRAAFARGAKEGVGVRSSGLLAGASPK